MRNVEDSYPLTPTQAGMLVQSLRDDYPALYFEQVRSRICGPFDGSRLRAAIKVVTTRHPALRTALVWDGVDQSVQAVRSTVEVPWEEIQRPDWNEEDVAAFAEQRRQAGFNFTEAPLHRVAVVSISPEDHHLVWEFNHIICDGWSAAMVLREVLSIYNGVELLPDPPPFREFLAWHERQDAASDLSYWAELLGGFATPNTFALRPPTSDSSFSAGQHTQSIAGAELDSLREFARDRGITLNTLLQGAWAIVQSRYSGVDDVVFGVTSSARPADLADVERIVGMFLTTLPLRVNIDSDQPIATFLTELQAQILSSSEHAAVSLAEVHHMAGLQPGQDLFDTVLVFEDFPKPDADAAAELQFYASAVFEQTNYPLTIVVDVDSVRLEMVAHYDRSRFTPDQAGTFMDRIESVLRTIVVASTVADVEFFTRDQPDDLDSWQGGKQLTPDATALVHPAESRVRSAPMEPLADLLRRPIPPSLVDSLKTDVARESTRPGCFVVPLRPSDPSVRTVFVFHGAGGSVRNFRELAAHLEGQLNVVGVQAAGVDGISPLHTTAEQMVTDYLEDIRAHQPLGPYMLAGFSIGGQIALAAAQQLMSDDQGVDCLALLDTYHPSLQPRKIPPEEHLRKVFTKPSYLIDKVRWRLERRRQRVEVAATPGIGDGDAVPFEVRKWEIMRNGMKLWADPPISPYEGPVLLVVPQEVDPIWDQVQADRGWTQALPDLEVVSVGGDHLSMMHEPFVAEMVTELLAHLDRFGTLKKV